MNPILKGDKIETRILRPSEFDMLLSGAKKLEYQTNLKALLLMGCRYLEGCRIQKNPKWFDHDTRTIHIKERKVESKGTDRYIHLSHAGMQVIPYFFAGKSLPQHPQGFLQDLRRWAIAGNLDPVGLSPRSMRKTWESWLMSVFPEWSHLIYLSQGHTEMTSIKHYQNLPFSKTDVEEMKKWVGGWHV